MRIKIVGENHCARATRGLLRQAGFAVTEFLPADAVTQSPNSGYVVTIESHAANEIALDSVDSPLEAAVLHHISQLSKLPVIVDRPGGVVHSDRELRVLLPRDNSEQATAVEYGVLRGLLDLAGPKLHAAPQPPAASSSRGWISKLLPAIAFAALCFPRAVHAAPAPRAIAPASAVSIHASDEAGNHLALAISPAALYPQLQQGTSQVNLASVGGATVSSALYDSSNNALLVHCVVGCTASGGFSDNAAFTAGSSPIGITGGWYSSSPTSCTSGNACAPQLTSDRKLYVQAFEGTSPWIVSAAGNGTVYSGQQSVTATASALASNSAKNVCVKALAENAINVYVGPSGVTSSTGMELAPDESICMPVSNTNLIYVVASSTGASVSWAATN
jgi:hypothetical protein